VCQEHGEQIFNERAAVVDEIPHRLLELLQQQVRFLGHTPTPTAGGVVTSVVDRVSDPDPGGSVPPGSGSVFDICIRIQQGKLRYEKSTIYAIFL
jgi:hypothetical protein